MKCILLLLFAIFSTSLLQSNLRDAFHPFIEGESINRKEALRDFSSIIFLFHSSSDFPKISRKLEKIAINELEKFGRVFPHGMTFPFDEQIQSSPIGRKALLIFDINSVYDAHQNPLPFLRASLLFEAPIVIDQNKEFSHGLLWMRETYIYVNSHKELKKQLTQAFKFLVNEFAADYFSVNLNLPVEPTFHFVLF